MLWSDFKELVSFLVNYDFMIGSTVGCFKKDTLKKIKCSPQHVTGGYLGSSYPEGNADRTSLGGWQSDLKFGKIGSGVVTMALQASIDLTEVHRVLWYGGKPLPPERLRWKHCSQMGPYLRTLFGILGPYWVSIYFWGSLFSVFWLDSREECQFSLHVYNNELSWSDCDEKSKLYGICGHWVWFTMSENFDFYLCFTR